MLAETREETKEETIYPVNPELTEIAPNMVLVEMSLENLRHGAEIAPEIWKPLLGGKLEKLWNDILPDEGDAVVVKGSSVLRMILGGYVLDKETGEAAEGMRSDIDMYALSPSVAERINNSKFRANDTAMSQTLEVAGIHVDATSHERIRHMNFTACQELYQALWNMADSDFKYQMIWQVEGQLGLINNVDDIGLQTLDNFYFHETMGIMLKRENGEIKAYFVDDNDALGTNPDNIMRSSNMMLQMQFQKAKGAYVGFRYDSTNKMSTQSLFLDAFLHPDFKNVEFSTKLPLYTLNNIPRFIRNACELDLELIYNPNELLSYSSGIEYERLWILAYRLNRGDNIFTVNSPDKISSSQEQDFSVETWIKKKMQESFARSAFSNPDSAIAYMTVHFPLANFISEDMNNVFKEFYDFGESRNNIWLPITHYKRNTEDMLSPEEAANPTIRFLVRLANISQQRFDIEGQHIQMQSVTDENKGLIYETISSPPENMSEIFALMFVSANWKIPQDEEKIKNTIGNWEVAGNLDLTWRKTQTSEFDMSVDYEKVVEKMSMFEQMEIEANARIKKEKLKNAQVRFIEFED